MFSIRSKFLSKLHALLTDNLSAQHYCIMTYRFKAFSKHVSCISQGSHVVLKVLKKYWISKLVFKTLKKYGIWSKCTLGIEKVWKL